MFTNENPIWWEYLENVYKIETKWDKSQILSNQSLLDYYYYLLSYILYFILFPISSDVQCELEYPDFGTNCRVSQANPSRWRAQHVRTIVRVKVENNTYSIFYGAKQTDNVCAPIVSHMKDLT